MRKLVIIAITAAVEGLGVSTAYAAAPTKATPEQVQSWATTARRYKTRFVPILEDPIIQENENAERLYTPPLGTVAVLDFAYARMLERLSNHDAVFKIAHNASGYIDAVRRTLTHSPDKSLNKLIGKALSQVGDVFDNCSTGCDRKAAPDARRSNQLWAQVEATLKFYGVHTGEPWALSTDSYQSTVITPGWGWNKYSFVRNADGSVTVTANSSNVDGNLRSAFWPAGQATATNAQSCATWVSESGAIVQEGAAFRVERTNNVTRAVTVTKNTFPPAKWLFNIHVWNGTDPQLLAQVDLGSVFHPNGVNAPSPWNLCAVVNDDTVSFIAWPGNEAKPAWGDPTHGGSATLPSGWVYPGQNGWYIGHLLPPGDSATFADLSVT
jgi:hypothetical protein